MLKKLPGLIDEAKERFSLLLILRQMATSDDAENEYLSCLHKCLAVAVDQKGISGLRPSILLEEICKVATEDLRRNPQQVRFQLYGSSAEDLHVETHVGVRPDFDIMIFPTADEVMIDDELIEYFPSNPLYVRIRGTGHPVLQSCLAENTEYVATSALKNFHPAIFGPVSITNNADDVFPSTFVPMPGLSLSVKNSMTSPAIKITSDLQSYARKFLNNFKLTLHKHYCKGGEEDSIVDCTCLSSEDENEYFSERIDSFLSKAKMLIEYIPAFRCLTWPMVAQEWRKRQRKWPSPDVVDQVIREGFHLVVKAPKNGGNPECDFRISFSHAEYLLSQEINEIQRECYRCLKTYHRVYLSTEPKGLLSFHLKNIFLRTIEETGDEMWIESRRAECMTKLFANLLKALREKHLPLYFVRSYNLFDIDYIEDTAILESLAERVEQIMENPVKFAEELIKVTQGKRSSPVQEQEQMNSPSNQPQSLKKENTELVGLKKMYLDAIKDLIEAVNNDDCILENLDPMERAVVEDLREMQKKCFPICRLDFLIPSVALLDHPIYTAWNLNDINVRHRVLTYVKLVTELYKYFMPPVEAAEGPKDIWSQMEHVLNPGSESPFDLNLFLPPDHGLEEDLLELFWTGAKCFIRAFIDVVTKDEDDIPLD